MDAEGGGTHRTMSPPRPKCAPCWGARGGHWSPPRPSCFSWDSLEHGGGPAAFAPPQKDSAPHRGDPRDHRHGGGDPKCPPPFPLSATIAGWGGTTPEPLPSPAGDGGAPAPLPPPGNGGHRLAPLCGVTPVPPNAPSPPPSPGLSPSLGRGGHTGVPPLICKYPPPPNHSISVGLGHTPHPPPQPPAPPSRAGGGPALSARGEGGGSPLIFICIWPPPAPESPTVTGCGGNWEPALVKLGRGGGGGGGRAGLGGKGGVGAGGSDWIGATRGGGEGAI